MDYSIPVRRSRGDSCQRLDELRRNSDGASATDGDGHSMELDFRSCGGRRERVVKRCILLMPSPPVAVSGSPHAPRGRRTSSRRGRRFCNCQDFLESDVEIVVADRHDAQLFELGTISTHDLAADDHAE